MKKITAVICYFLFIASSVANASPVNGAWYRSGDVHFEGVIYAGTGGVALTDATGNLVTTSLTASGNVAITGTLASGALTVTGAETVSTTLAVTGATTLSSTLAAGATTITGAASATTTVTSGTMFIEGVSATVTAAGTAKTDCTALTKAHNVVSTATALQGVCLPAAVAGQKDVFIYNSTAVTIVAYPKDSDDAALTFPALGALATDAGWTIGPKGSMSCKASSATSWLCEFKLGATASVATAGNGQSSYQALASVNLGSHVMITGSDGTKGVTLPTGSNLGCLKLYNQVSTSVLILTGHNSDNDTINGGSADAAQNFGAGGIPLLCTTDGVAWQVY